MRIFQRLVALSLVLSGTALCAAEKPAAVGCQGRIVPGSRALHLAAPTDQGTPIVSKLLVEEGTTYQAGTVVAVLMAEEPARLLKAQAQAKHQNAVADHAAIGAVAAQEDAQIALQVLDARNAIATADAAAAALKTQAARRRLSDEAVSEAEAALAAQTAAAERLRADRPATVARLDAAIHSAQVQVDETSGSRRIIATAARDEARAAKETALREYDARLAGAVGEETVLKAKLAAARVLNAQTEREPAEADAAATQATLAKERIAALEDYRAKTRRRYEADAAAAAGAVEEAAAALRVAETRHALTSIRSPITGRVLRVLARAGEAVGPAGVVEIADLRYMEVEAEVNIADLPRVKTGAVAEIRVPGLEKVFSGKVSRIGQRVVSGALADENPAAFKDLRVVPVTLRLDNTDGTDDTFRLDGYTGAQVSVRILPAQ
ncbi:MAG: HlyD family efflux transporter periplasmic adaptor subunit [Puniceicoccales bacterium]|jgi:HlyD family secretion protein|nr:HlyD family efflux transporter periplasmic adaptor subunit [Puniceicoccales bacterium]